jgi:predicted nucleic acid-binding protein
MFIIDASVALSWCFADEDLEAADAVLDRLTIEEALVPAIWPFEVANGLRSAERQGRLRANEIPRVRGILVGLPIVVDETDLAHAVGPTLDAALRLGISVYDAAYVVLAAREDAPLASVDDRLRAAARTFGVELVT